MAKIQINNPRQIINGGAKKYYFKVKGLGGPKGDKGDKGDTGSQGPQGPQGNAATVSIGSTTTLPVGYDATVTNSGSIYNAVLDFGIPQGPQGPQGAKGDKGDTGAQGETGPRGPQGERGTNATVYVGTTTTTNPGTQARVYNSGTDSNAVLNFEIPRGDVGPSVPLAQETGYSTTKAMSQNATTEALNGKQNTLTAGSNIQISGSTISATDTKYSAGNGLNLNGTEFSADTTVLATQADLTTALAPKLEAEVVAELPATGTEGKLYLTPKAHTTQTATGNPITASVSEEAGAIESFQLDGDTFQQTYEGKNLFNKDTELGCYIQSSGSITANDVWNCSQLIKVEPNTRYLWHGESYGLPNQVVWAGYNSSQAFISGQHQQANSTTSLSIITGEETEFIRVGYRKDSLKNMQLELGSTASDYEPFVGGVPSPNPDYPQPIQTVTGLQTISINGTDYPINLGNIELCKLGDYQDYIWKDGEDWKIHKATVVQTYDGSSDENWGTTGTNVFAVPGNGVPNLGAPQLGINASFIFNPVQTSVSGTLADGEFALQQNAGTNGRLFFKTTKASTVEDFISWLTSNNQKIYYGSATPTDTVITDTTLIAQLEAIRTASLENGANTITNTATGSNLAGDMEIGYYGFAPRNRYDKWLWLDINNEYEQIGS